jgi:hypothetical protein
MPLAQVRMDGLPFLGEPPWAIDEAGARSGDV